MTMMNNAGKAARGKLVAVPLDKQYLSVGLSDAVCAAWDAEVDAMLRDFAKICENKDVTVVSNAISRLLCAICVTAILNKSFSSYGFYSSVKSVVDAEMAVYALAAIVGNDHLAKLAGIPVGLRANPGVTGNADPNAKPAAAKASE